MLCGTRMESSSSRISMLSSTRRIMRGARGRTITIMLRRYTADGGRTTGRGAVLATSATIGLTAMQARVQKRGRKIFLEDASRVRGVQGQPADQIIDAGQSTDRSARPPPQVRGPPVGAKRRLQVN